MSYNSLPIANYSEQKGYNVYFTHVPTGRQVYFPAFLKSYSDGYTSQWGTDTVFGRTDPIHLFQQTTRAINFSIEVPSASEDEAKRNLVLVRNLARFLYPTYQKVEVARVINDFPLVRIKFSNLIGRGAAGIGSGQLLGFIQSVGITFNTEAGFFDPAKALYPKVFEVSISFTVQHDEDPTAMMSPETDSGDPYADEKDTTTALDNKEANAATRQDTSVDSPAWARRLQQNFSQGLENVVREEIGLSQRARPDYSFTGQTRTDVEVDDYYAAADEEAALDEQVMLGQVNSRNQ
jgi:hypothetical protein